MWADLDLLAVSDPAQHQRMAASTSVDRDSSVGARNRTIFIGCGVGGIGTRSRGPCPSLMNSYRPHRAEIPT